MDRESGLGAFLRHCMGACCAVYDIAVYCCCCCRWLSQLGESGSSRPAPAVAMELGEMVQYGARGTWGRKGHRTARPAYIVLVSVWGQALERVMWESLNHRAVRVWLAGWVFSCFQTAAPPPLQLDLADGVVVSLGVGRRGCEGRQGGGPHSPRRSFQPS